jgi:hypothetical protein
MNSTLVNCAQVAVEDLRSAVTAERLLQGLDAEVRGQRYREPPGQDLNQSLTAAR